MTTNELTKIWAKISGLFARKTEVATKADKAVVVTLSPDIDQQIVTDKTFAEVLALLSSGTEVMFDYQHTYMEVSIFNDTAIDAFAVDRNTIVSILWNKDNGITVSETDLQEKLAFDEVPQKGSTNPVRSNGLYEYFSIFFKGLQNFCPLIEDTRASAVSEITGVAPFATLQDGQRILLQVKQMIPNDAVLRLTLADGTVTQDIPMYQSYQSTINKAWNNNIRAGMYIELIYTANNNRWTLVGNKDTNTTYNIITQAEITAGSSTSTRLVTPKLLVDNFDRRRLYVDNSADASVELSVATYNDLGTTDAPVVSLPASYTAADEFLFSFTCATDACVVTLPQGVVLADCCDDFSEVASGVWFQVSIMDGVAAYLCVTPQN